MKKIDLATLKEFGSLNFELTQFIELEHDYDISHSKNHARSEQLNGYFKLKDFYKPAIRLE